MSTGMIPNPPLMPKKSNANVRRYVFAEITKDFSILF
jgi:hypothetical protein